MSLIVYSQWAMTKQVYRSKLDFGHTHAVIFNMIGSLALISHTTAMFTNPGAVPKDAEPLPGDAQRLKEALAQNSTQRKRTKGWCHRCVAYKPPRAHHDSVTGRCIIKLDHFCPWTNNAIGVRNHKSFLLFIFYTFLMCSYALALLIRLAYASIIIHPSTEEEIPSAQGGLRGRASEMTRPTTTPSMETNHEQEFLKKRPPDELGLACVMVGVFAILFGIFTSCMLCDQWSVLSTNIAKIDRLKGEELTVSSKVNEVFGGKARGFHIHWLIPIPPHYPDSVHDDVMGYRMPHTSNQTENRITHHGRDNGRTTSLRTSEDIEAPSATRVSSSRDIETHQDVTKDEATTAVTGGDSIEGVLLNSDDDQTLLRL